jgi:REP element-mobilizing transposase RayT
MNAVDKGLQLDSVGGHLEHIHCLLQLNATQSISDTIQLIKGESSRWFNLSGLSKNKLSWQSDYFAVSVSESMVDAVRAYISRQEAHHRRITFQEEYDEFMKKYGFGG